MSIKGVKLKSESFFSISPGVLELWRKNPRGADSASPPGPDRVKPDLFYFFPCAQNTVVTFVPVVNNFKPTITFVS